ncbi:MAG: type II toxin-antitoxin system VapC family toxin [Pirellulaceae bacterium]
MESVYLETSVIGYLASRPSNEIVTAASQFVTRQWWDQRRHEYELFISPAVIAESNAGDPKAAKERAVFVDGLEVLEITTETERLAETLQRVPLPRKADVDALHIAIAAVNGITFLLTWNCKHIANPALRPIIEQANGYGVRS